MISRESSCLFYEAIIKVFSAHGLLAFWLDEQFSDDRIELVSSIDKWLMAMLSIVATVDGYLLYDTSFAFVDKENFGSKNVGAVLVVDGLEGV